MLYSKKNSYKEFDNEKNSCGSKIPQYNRLFIVRFVSSMLYHRIFQIISCISTPPPPPLLPKQNTTRLV